MPASVDKRDVARLRKRSVFLSLAGVVPLTLFVQWSDLVVGGTMAAGPFPPLAACLFWAFLILINWLSSRISRSKPFLLPSELLIIFAVWASATMVSGRGLTHALLSSLAGPVYYARTGLAATSIRRHLPDWLAITDRNVAVRFYEGGPGGVDWGVWAPPLLTWSLFFLLFLIANISLCALFERIWIREERLSFPLVNLPLELLQLHSEPQNAKGFRAALLIGVAIPLFLHGFGAAHAYQPAIPCVSFFNDVSDFASNPPWSAIRPLYLNLYPILIGLAFLAPTEISLSVWFFLLLNKAELLVTAIAGWNDGAAGGAVPVPPYVEEQSAGAFIALAIALVWNSKRHLRGLFESEGASRRDEEIKTTQSSDRETDRLFAATFVCGFVGVLAWCFRTGMPLWFSLGFFGFYFAVALVLSRLMSESGVTWLLAPILPDKLILSLTGSQALSQLALTRLTLHVQHLRDTRQMLAPALFQSGKMREESKIEPKAFYSLMLAAVVIAFVSGVLFALPIFHHYGALTLAPNSDGVMMTAKVIPTTAVNQLSQRLLTPIHPSPQAFAGVLAGAGVTALLASLRMRYLWWGLHPIGYALTGTLQTGYAAKMVFSVFLGWLFKSLVMRFGGSRGFRLLRRVALGLILGDLIMGAILKLCDWLLAPSGYAIF